MYVSMVLERIGNWLVMIVVIDKRSFILLAAYILLLPASYCCFINTPQLISQSCVGRMCDSTGSGESSNHSFVHLDPRPECLPRMESII